MRFPLRWWHRPRDQAQPTSGLLIAGVDELTDPLPFGVHRAAALDGDHVPPFVPRELLPDLARALAKGGFVLVVGDSTAGKTRLAYEAMRACLPRHTCVRPDGQDTLRVALDATKAHRPSVLWLDDLDRYLGGLTRADVTDPNTVVLATMRTQERQRLARAGRELLSVVTTEVQLDRMWSGQELSAAAHTADPRIARAVLTADRHGIAEQLAAAPELSGDLRDAGDTHARGAALVTAAVDLRRAGCHRPAPLEVLRTLHESYLAPDARPESWEEALSWATRPLHGTSSLLAPAGDGYLAFDYLLDRQDPIPDAVWHAILDFASPVELVAVAAEAAFHGRPGFLRAAFAKALAHKDFMVAARLADILGEFGFEAEATELLGDVAVAAAGAIPPAELIHIRWLRVWHTGEGVVGRGDPDRAFALARDLVQDSTDLLGDTAAQTYHARRALVRNTPDPAEALNAARTLLTDVATHLGLGHELTLAARAEEAMWVRRVEGPRAAVRLYYDLLEQAEAFESVDPALYVDAQWNLGGSLLEAGETRSAVEVLEVAVENALLYYGADHGITLEVRLTQVAALDGDAQHKEALALAEQLALDAERALGTDHPTTTDARFAVDQLTTPHAL